MRRNQGEKREKESKRRKAKNRPSRKWEMKMGRERKREKREKRERVSGRGTERRWLIIGSIVVILAASGLQYCRENSTEYRVEEKKRRRKRRRGKDIT